MKQISEWFNKNQIHMVVATVMVFVAFFYGIHIGGIMKVNEQKREAKSIALQAELDEALAAEQRLYTWAFDTFNEALTVTE